MTDKTPTRPDSNATTHNAPAIRKVRKDPQAADERARQEQSLDKPSIVRVDS